MYTPPPGSTARQHRQAAPPQAPPSNADFESYIKGSPKMQVNRICDSHGYYVIDILNSAYNRASPLLLYR